MTAEGTVSQPTTSSARRNLVIWSCLANAAGFLILIFFKSFQLDGHRWFLLDDDPMISMRYARNLVEGNGLVWNIGDKIEGFTNPLWVLVMTIPHVLSLPVYWTSLVPQIANLGLGVLVVALSFRLAKVMAAGSPRAAGLEPLAAVAVALYAPLAYLGVLGYETTLLAVLVTFAWIDAIEGKASPVRPTLLLTLAVLTRPDALIFFLPVGLTYVLAGKAPSLLPAAALVLIILGLAEIGRYLYYGQLLPNTFYLKSNMLLDGGLSYTRSFYLMGGGLLAVAVLAFSSYVTRSRHVIILLGTFLLLSGYVVYIGGDFLELGRYYLPIMPAVIVACVVYGGGSLRTTGVLPTTHGLLSGAYVLVLIVGLNLWAVRFLGPQLLRGDFGSEDADNARMALALQPFITDDTVIADVYAGVIPYITGNPAVDLLGKTDPVIARSEPHAGANVPGHNKYDFDYSLGHYQPDIVISIIPNEEVTDASELAASDWAEGDFAFAGRMYANKIFLEEYYPNRVTLPLARATFIRTDSPIRQALR